MAKAVKKAKRPRRTPSTPSAQATVAAIVDGAARTLVRRGYAGATTNHIAREAGVGVGSFYEYFENKDAAVVAVVERFASRAFAHAEGRAQELKALGLPPVEVVRRFVHSMVELFAADAALLRTLYQQVPFVWESPRVQGLVSQLERLGLEITDAYSVRAPLSKMRDRFYVLGVALGASIVQIATDPHAVARRQDLSDELSVMIVRYLRLRDASGVKL